jgi:pyrroline-5-carboxylate reductase
MAAKLSIGFLGAGKMATALARGIVEAGVVTPAQIRGSDPVPASLALFSKETGAKAAKSNTAVVEFANILVLAVKPAHVAEVLEDIRPKVTPDHLLISICAGVPIAKLENGLESGSRVIRVMPNTPALVNASATAYALGKNATAADADLAHKLFSAVGIAFKVKENLLDAVTGLSGSGPAYIYLIIEALSDGGVASGLPRDIATKLAAQTVFGSAKMVLETGQHPGALKDNVTSPGGTTIEGLHELEKGKVRGVLINAVRAATEKSRKLGL